MAATIGGVTEGTGRLAPPLGNGPSKRFRTRYTGFSKCGQTADTPIASNALRSTRRKPLTQGDEPGGPVVDSYWTCFSSMRKIAPHLWHLPRRPSISGWPSNSCPQAGQENVWLGRCASSPTATRSPCWEIVKMCWHTGHCPFVPTNFRSHTRLCAHFGHWITAWPGARASAWGLGLAAATVPTADR